MNAVIEPTQTIEVVQRRKSAEAQGGLLSNHAFLNFWIGQAGTMLATQVFAVSLTWLLLQITGSGTALGSVLVAAAIPRALFILIGGAISDRVTRWKLLFRTVTINAIVMSVIAAMLSFDALTLLPMYVLAVIYGLTDAFLFPAMYSSIPRLVRPDQLAQANAFGSTTETITNILGPAGGGFLIGLVGLPTTFLLTTGLYALGALCFIRLRRYPDAFVSRPADSGAGLGEQVREGLGYAWSNRVIRLTLGIIAAINFAVLGPIVVGTAALVEVRLGNDPGVYGMLLAAFAIGALPGAIIAGTIRREISPALMLALISFSMGIGLILTGFVETALAAVIIYSLTGVGVGFGTVIATTWLQKRTPMELQGRVTGLLIFSAIALDPFSNAFAGFMLDVSLTGLFVIAGGMMLGVGLLAFSQRHIREDS
jgi:MFS family permease